MVKHSPNSRAQYDSKSIQLHNKNILRKKAWTPEEDAAMAIRPIIIAMLVSTSVSAAVTYGITHSVASGPPVDGRISSGGPAEGGVVMWG